MESNPLVVLPPCKVQIQEARDSVTDSLCGHGKVTVIL